jgi:hypothetical protein
MYDVYFWFEIFIAKNVDFSDKLKEVKKSDAPVKFALHNYKLLEKFQHLSF